MKRLLCLVTLCIGAIAFVPLIQLSVKAETSTKTFLHSIQESGSGQWEHVQDTTLERIRNSDGKIAELTMKICFSAGYPHNTGTYNNLSRREVAECDAILARIDREDARIAAEKAKRDLEYDKKHPTGAKEKPAPTKSEVMTACYVHAQSDVERFACVNGKKP